PPSHPASYTLSLHDALPIFDVDGETAIMFVDGAFSHAVRKGPILTPDGAMTDELFAPEEIRPRDPSAAELALAEQVLTYVRGRLDRKSTRLNSSHVSISYAV